MIDSFNIYAKCVELGLDVDVVYADVVAQRKLARNRIQELEVEWSEEQQKYIPKEVGI